jgi:glucose/arabinose dehydrogenase
MRYGRVLIGLALALTSCGGAGSTGTPASSPSNAPSKLPSSEPAAQSCVAAATSAPAPAGASPQPAHGLNVPSGLRVQVIAHVDGARELAAAPNGDVFVGTTGSNVYIIANAEGQAANPAVFTTLPDSPAAGVALALAPQTCALYVGTEFGVYRVSYAVGDRTARSAPAKIASVRPGGGGDHNTTSVAFVSGVLYASVGSSCNACAESDPTRATIQQMRPDGSGMPAKAVHIRNAIALAVNPQTGTLWAGDAGQDALPSGHPYEFFDGVTLHAGTADYGWPGCEENRHAYTSGANCSNTVIPLVEFPAYETIIGAAFYPQNQSGAYVFPASYRGGAFVTMHGSWHTGSGGYAAPPLVAFVPMSGDTPRTAVHWSNPTAQWTPFVSGFQLNDGTSRIGRPTGVAVGASGSLFIADDQTGSIYRIRP